MFKVKETESKVTPSKKNITISDIRVNGDILVDEEGSIAQRLKAEIGDLVDSFTMKITLELPEDTE